MKFLAVALIVLIGTNSAFGQFWRQCRTGGRLPENVEADACTGNLCQAVRGSTLSAIADIIVSEPHQSLRSEYHAYVLGLWVDISGSEDNSRVCFELNAEGTNSCPLTPGQVYRWHVNVS